MEYKILRPDGEVRWLSDRSHVISDKHGRALGCEFGQGYFFSKPLNCASAEAMIAANAQW